MPTSPQLVAALSRHADYEQPEGVPSAHLLHPLSARGREQARLLAEQLERHAREFGWSIHRDVYSSSLLRAFETASLAAAQLSALCARSFQVVQLDALCERSVGAAANLTVTEIESVLARDPRHGAPPSGWKERSEYRLPVPGAESLHQAGARVAACLREVTGAVASTVREPTVVVFVGHGAAIRHAAVHLGTLAAAEVSQLSMHHAQPVYLDATGPTWPRVAGAWKQRTRKAVD